MVKHVAMIAGLSAGLMLAAGPALAQDQPAAPASPCQQIGKLLQERQGIMQRINAMGRRNVNPQTACQLFGRLASNGTRTIALLKDNKEWCQVPDELANNLTASQGQINSVRGKACNAAQQQATLQRRAQQAQRQQQEGAGTFGGVDGFSAGPWKVPQGAL